MLQFFKNIFMNRKYQLGYSDLKPSMYKQDERIKKANKFHKIKCYNIGRARR